MTPEPGSVKAPPVRLHRPARPRPARPRHGSSRSPKSCSCATGMRPPPSPRSPPLAGVSVETIYKTFGGKPGLIRAIQRIRACRHGPVPAPDSSDEMSAQRPRAPPILRHWADLTAEVMPRVAPIILLVRAAAATDPDMGRLLAEINDERLQRMHHNASRLIKAGQLRAANHSRTGPRRHVHLHRAGNLRDPRHPPTMVDRSLRRLHLPRSRRRTPRQPTQVSIPSDRRTVTVVSRAAMRRPARRS